MIRRGRSALLLSVLVLAGCGGSHHAAPPPTTTPPPPPPPAPAPPPAPPSPVPPSHRVAVGIDYDCLTDTAAQKPKVFARLEAAHVSWVRINANWRSLEPHAKGHWDAKRLRALDQCVSLAVQGGLAPELIFISTPAWAGPDAHASPTRAGSYAHALAYLAKRYRGQVRAWEVWAEENTTRMWKDSPASYARLLRSAYPAVKRADPQALVVFGGPYGNDVRWVRAVYAAGAKGSFDVMATHPYTDGAADIRPIRRLMVENGDASKPVWFTEMGYAAPLRMTLAAQARRLRSFFGYTRKHLPYVHAIFWFQIVGVNPNASPWEHDLQVLNRNLSPRPAYYALKREASGD